MSKLKLCVHAHFFQPPRQHPLTGHIGAERIAAPYRNWNERATEEVYHPNARQGNFAHLSFDIGQSLLDWLQMRHKTVYETILASAAAHLHQHHVGNVLATPLHQAPLTTLKGRDRLTQLRWGATATQMRFGHIPKGVFLPHFAVDDATLQAVVDAGFAYTLLRASQVVELPKRGGAGPYRVRLASGDSILVFVVDDALSASMIEEMVERGGAGYWARTELGSHIRFAGKLTLLYADGELLGQHKMAESYFIHYLLRHEAPAVAFQPITLEHYYKQAPDPIGEIELRPYIAEEPSEAQGYLFAGLRQVMDEADVLFADVYGDEAWQRRERALEFAHSDKLMLSQVILQQAWANIAALETHPQMTLAYVLRDIAYAIFLIDTETQTDLSARFKAGLPLRAAALFDEAMSIFREPQIASVQA